MVINSTPSQVSEFPISAEEAENNNVPAAWSTYQYEVDSELLLSGWNTTEFAVCGSVLGYE